MTLTAVLFDLDGTLFDHYYAADESIREFAAKHGTTLQGDEAIKRWEELDSEHYPKGQNGELPFEEVRRVRLREFDQQWADLSNAELDQIFADYIAAYRKYWRVFPEARNAAQACFDAGLTVGILTNGVQSAQEDKTALLGFEPSRIPVFASSEMPAGKPDERAFRIAADGLGIDLATTLMVGDSPESDIAGAKAVGCHAVWVNRRDRKALEDTRTVPDLSGMANILRQY